MRLVSARVRLFRNIVDSGEVLIDENVTALVGKNESGKSAFLDALYRLNPAYSEEFSTLNDYPRWRLRRDERQGDLSRVRPVSATFELDEDDRREISGALGLEIPLPPAITVARTYGNELEVDLQLDEPAIVSSLLDESEVDVPGSRPTDISQLSAALDDLKASAAATNGLDETAEESDVESRTNTNEAEEALGELQEKIEALTSSGSIDATIGDLVRSQLPTFFRFNEWSGLPARIDLAKLVSAEPESLSADMRTALSLVTMSGGTAQEFLEEDYETRVAELEASANEITSQVFEYWTQNDTLEVHFDTETENRQTPQGQQTVLTHLQVRIRDRRHAMTTSFGVRSTGFQWFFSFLAAFYEYENRNDIVVLLDEPGLGLHGRAQKDFMRFINERLAQQHQVLYTTHSPFMVESGHLERVRLVEDSDDLDVASTISGEIRVRDPDTLFPLQAALGYDIAQALFAAGHNLIVEGVSDYIYLVTLSDHLESIGRTALAEKWNVVPVGGASKIPTFVALLGLHLDVTVLVDSSPGPNDRISQLADRGILERTRILSISQSLGKPNVDIEDLFTPGEYLKLYNAAFGTSVRVSDLTGTDGIVRRVSRYSGSDFNHAEPAMAMLQIRDSFLSSLSSGTLDRFEALFNSVNATAP